MAPQERYAGLDVGEDFDLYELDLTRDNATPRVLLCCDINRPRAGAIKTLRYVHNETAPTLTRDGDLFFWSERFDAVGERDVFVAPADGAGGYQAARPLPAPINSKGREDSVWVSPDGNLMLLASNARGGSGGDDLFVSRKQGDQWLPPVNLGPDVNSSYNELAARVTPDGKHLVFTSDRPFDNQEGGLLQVWSVDVAAIHALRAGPGAD